MRSFILADGEQLAATHLVAMAPIRLRLTPKPRQPVAPKPPADVTPSEPIPPPTTKVSLESADAPEGQPEPSADVRREMYASPMRIEGWSRRPEVRARIAAHRRLQLGVR